MPTFMYGVLSSKKKAELISKRNVRVIKEFLRKREKLETSKEKELSHLKQLRRGRSINASMYRRLKQIMIMTHEQKRIDLVKTSIEKSVELEKSVANCDNQPLEPNAERS